jgi:N-acetylneuraminate synthase
MNWGLLDRKLAAGEILVIAEVAQAHDGSLGTAHAYIDAAADAGADVVKFQTHIADAESTIDEPWRVQFSSQDSSRIDYWKRMEFTPEQWLGLARHAKERGLEFLSTPFSLAAVDLLEGVGVPAWKIGSGDISNLPLLEKVARTGKSVLLSSGMSSWDELDVAVDCVRSHGARAAIFQCTTAYPCPPEKVGLNAISHIRERYECPVGLSDHSGTVFAGIAAASLGANLLEVHVVFDRRCFGPDVQASLTLNQLQELVQGVRFIERAMANPVDKDQYSRDMEDIREMFSRSVVAACDLEQGKELTFDDLAFKKPGGGIPAGSWRELIGRTLRRDLTKDTRISEDDLD